MTTPRNSYKIDESKPGSDVVAETAAALAAASLAFAKSDAKYASTLLTHAKQMFDFAGNHRGLYQNSVHSSRGDNVCALYCEQTNNTLPIWILITTTVSNKLLERRDTFMHDMRILSLYHSIVILYERNC